MDEPQELLYRVTCDSGDIAIVRPFSPLAYHAFVVEAERLYPPPNEADYVQPLENAAVEGLTVPAKDNPKYTEAAVAAMRQQVNWTYLAVIRSGVVIDTEEGQEATIERYRPQIDILREQAGVEEDGWLATVLYGVIRTQRDILNIVSAARGSLTQEEIRAAVEAFRRPIQRNQLVNRVNGKTASRVKTATRQTAEALSGGEHHLGRDESS